MKKLLLLLAALLPIACRAAEPRWAVVNVSSSFLRAKPDYESSNESQCLMGTVLEVTGSDRYWRRVNAPDYKDVWTTELTLAFMTDAQKDEYIAAPKWICTAGYSHIYTKPSVASQPLCDFTMGDLVRRTGASADGFVGVLTASGTEGWVPAADVEDYDKWVKTRHATADNIVKTALRFLGTPYMWGGNTIKHFDCSGFCKFVYMMNGVVLLRNAREQIRTGVAVPFDFKLMQPGDLVYFGSAARGSVTHVGLYIGDGRIIHSSQLVRINSLKKGEPDYYEKEVVGVRRMLGHVDTGEGVSSVSSGPWYFKK